MGDGGRPQFFMDTDDLGVRPKVYSGTFKLPKFVLMTNHDPLCANEACPGCRSWLYGGGVRRRAR